MNLGGFVRTTFRRSRRKECSFGEHDTNQWEWGPSSMRKLLSLASVLALSLVVVPAPAANAAPTTWVYAASTGATYVNALGGTVSSDLTAQSYISGADSNTHSNSTAGVDAAAALSVGAAQTTTSAVRTDEGTTLTSYARTTGVKLLGGLISADAVETSISTTGKPTGTTAVTGGTKLVGLKIIGVDLPVHIPQNYNVTIPGVANVTINFALHGSDSGLAITHGWALAIQLLQDRNGLNAGATVMLNPVHHYLMEEVPSHGARLNGFAYSSRVETKVGDSIKVVSDPTAYQGTPIASSEGATLRNSTASANIPGLATLGTLTSTSLSNRDKEGNGEITNVNKTVGLNLLGGLITADAIEVTAQGKLQDGEWTQSMKMTAVNLIVAGQRIPVDVAPNTAIDVAGLGKVEINKQGYIPGANINRIDGLRITLDTARAGLPVGAVIELAVAATIIEPAGS